MRGHCQPAKPAFFARTAHFCRSKKRGSTAGAPAAQPADSLPVTRSGRVRRSADGLVNTQQQQQQRGGAAVAAAAVPEQQKENAGGQGGMEWEGAGVGQRRKSGASLRAGAAGSSGSGGGGGLGLSSVGRHDSPEPASSATLVVVRGGRTCTVLEGCLADDPAECLTVCVRSFTGLERWFLCNKAIRCGAIFEMVSSPLGGWVAKKWPAMHRGCHHLCAAQKGCTAHVWMVAGRPVLPSRLQPLTLCASFLRKHPPPHPAVLRAAGHQPGGGEVPAAGRAHLWGIHPAGAAGELVRRLPEATIGCMQGHAMHSTCACGCFIVPMLVYALCRCTMATS